MLKNTFKKQTLFRIFSLSHHSTTHKTHIWGFEQGGLWFPGPSHLRQVHVYSQYVNQSQGSAGCPSHPSCPPAAMAFALGTEWGQGRGQHGTHMAGDTQPPRLRNPPCSSQNETLQTPMAAPATVLGSQPERTLGRVKQQIMRFFQLTYDKTSTIHNMISIPVPEELQHPQPASTITGSLEQVQPRTARMGWYHQY